eukprot:4697234-Pyramimonas_sp.AAC.1
MPPTACIEISSMTFLILTMGPSNDALEHCQENQPRQRSRARASRFWPPSLQRWPPAASRAAGR